MKNIEKMYQHYLSKVKLTEKDMPEVQRVETKRAFVAGFAEALNHLVLSVPPYYTDDQFTERVNKVVEEVKDFFQQEIINHKNKQS